MNRILDVDERTLAVDREAAYRAYMTMSWLLVLDLALHGMAPGWIDWNGFPVDIPAILLAGGATWLARGLGAGTISRRRGARMAIALLAGMIVAAVVAGLTLGR